MTQTLIICSTTDGHTAEICRKIENILKDSNESTEIRSAANLDIDLTRYSKIVIGASIRYGYHNKALCRFIETNSAALNQKPSAFFSVNLVARKDNKNTPQTNPYCRKFLKRTTWKPDLTAVFAGKLNYPVYGPIDKTMIRLIMWMTKDPTDPDAVVEFTNWDHVNAFARQITELDIKIAA